jgi:hypothetical protein
MDEIQKELQQEEELLKPSKEEEVRAEMIEKYGLDEVEHETLIENLVKDRLADQKRFGEVIGQKRKWREKAQEKPAPKAPVIEPEEIDKKARQIAREELDNEYLEDLDVSDEIKSDIKKLAALQGVSVRKAASDPYIIHKKEQYEQAKKIEEATISRKNNTAAATAFSIDNPPKLDLSLDPNSPEGKAAVAKFQKEQAAWMEQAKKS